MYFEYFLVILLSILIFLRLRKKIKKYNSIYNLNGLDGVYFHFVNKNFNNTGLLNFVDKKKKYFRKRNIQNFKKSNSLWSLFWN